MFGANTLRVDLRVDPPIVEEISENLPNNKVMAIHNKQAQYRFDCMMGAEHPLNIEREHYILTTVATRHMDTVATAQMDRWSKHPTFNEAEIDFIMSVQQRPEIEWAIDNSFDGIYVQKEEDFARFATTFRFAVYMKEEQVTFWKLKYNGR